MGERPAVAPAVFPGADPITLTSRRSAVQKTPIERFASSCALCVAALLSMSSIPSRAQTIEVGTGVFCDTQQQMERYVAVLDGDMRTALNIVNAEENDPNACVFGTIAFIRSTETATARTRSATYQIVKVLVVGFLTQSGFQAARPMASFSVEKVDERIA
jgi:hypothetical protein